MNHPAIVAHRGLHDEHPENSIKAFLAAWEAGIDWCECDVRGSRELEPFVLHDPTLQRTTSGSGFIAETPSSVLHRLSLRPENRSLVPACVPRLSTVIAAIPHGKKLLVEIKPGVAREVVQRTMELCDPETCVVQSFDQWVLRQASEVRTDVPLALLVENAAAPTPRWPRIHARHDMLDPQIIADLHGRGIAIGAWTVNNDADIQRILGFGVDMIISDRPLRVRDIRQKIG